MVLTETGMEVARRAALVLSAVRDLDEFAKHRGRMLCGPLRLGMIPSLAPYLLPIILPPLQRLYPDLQLELRETQTRALLEELSRGALDAAMLALPAHIADTESMTLFEDRFLLATTSGESSFRNTTVSLSEIDRHRLILLEEGHCLRDQALAVCGAGGGAPLKELGATSLTTVMQMVANGYGVTLVPEIAAEVEARDKRVRLLRFRKPEPHRTIGLVWRRTSPRSADFKALGRAVIEALNTRK
jgi:LysR family hydrogen peroxide-inducible transcriptional activator